MRNLVCFLIASATITGAVFSQDLFPDWKEIYREDFSTGVAQGWTFADSKAWKVGTEGDSFFLSAFKDSDYKPEVRSPENIAWLDQLKVGSFVLDATVRSTQPEYGHRDVCFLFNRVDASHFYYAHIATKADEHANSVFLVNGAPRVSICEDRTDGTGWTEHWHHVRIVREIESGKIEVYFDDMQKPIMKTSDMTFKEGNLGFGAFDDTADLMELIIRAPE